MDLGKNKYFDTFVYWLCLAFAELIKAMPLKCAYAFSRFIFKIIYYVDPVHRKRTIRNLLYAGVAKDEKEAIALAKKNYVQHSKVMTEVFKMHQIITPENVSEHIKIVGSEKARKLVEDDKSQLILLTGHFGNWEIAGICYTFLSGRELLSVKKSMRVSKIGNLIFREREKYKHTCCEKKGAIIQLMKALKRGKSAALLVDQHASTSEGVEVTFFGKPARAHASPGLLHIKTGIPILVSMTRRIDDDFHFEFLTKDPIMFKGTGDMEADLKYLTQLYTTQLEELIRVEPEQWLWAHRRWLHLDRDRSKKNRKKRKHEITKTN